MTQGFALPLSVTKLQLLHCTWLPCGGPAAGLAAPIIPIQPCKTCWESHQLKRLHHLPPGSCFRISPSQGQGRGLRLLGSRKWSLNAGWRQQQIKPGMYCSCQGHGMGLCCWLLCKTTWPKRWGGQAITWMLTPGIAVSKDEIAVLRQILYVRCWIGKNFHEQHLYIQQLGLLLRNDISFWRTESL